MSFIEPFLEMLCVERGAAQNTLMAYKKDLEAINSPFSLKYIEIKP